jgi:hypothetical protein
LKRFQEDKGMAATGQLNSRVIGALGFDPQRFVADNYGRSEGYRSPGERGVRSGSEPGRHYWYSGRDRDYGYGGGDGSPDSNGCDESIVSFVSGEQAARNLVN